MTHQKTKEKFISPDGADERNIIHSSARFLARKNARRWRRFLGGLSATPVTIINDCVGDNEAARQETRVASLFESHVSYIRVSSPDQLDADLNRLQASGNIIDQLDAFEDRRGVLLAHVMPRHGEGKQGEGGNGSRYGYFWYKNVLVVASLDGPMLSLVKKLGLADSVRLLDVGRTLSAMEREGLIGAEEILQIAHSQFKSFMYLPKIAAYLLKKGRGALSETVSIKTAPDAPRSVWCVDGFGNCKTTLLPEEFCLSSDARLNADTDGVSHGPVAYVETRFGELPLYRRLADVPDGTLALTIGSSGIGSGKAERRFIEIVVSGGSAADTLGLSVGDSIMSA